MPKQSSNAAKVAFFVLMSPSAVPLRYYLNMVGTVEDIMRYLRVSDQMISLLDPPTDEELRVITVISRGTPVGIMVPLDMEPSQFKAWLSEDEKVVRFVLDFEGGMGLTSGIPRDTLARMFQTPWASYMTQLMVVIPEGLEEVEP